MKSSGRGMPFAEINVTPMVDVMLVLLIIFMVAAPLLDQGIDVALPRASTGRQLSGSDPSITLTKDHVLYFEDEVVTLKTLRQKLGAYQRRPVLIRADRSAYVSRLVELWDLCRELGFKDIHIATMSE